MACSYIYVSLAFCFSVLHKYSDVKSHMFTRIASGFGHPAMANNSQFTGMQVSFSEECFPLLLNLVNFIFINKFYAFSGIYTSNSLVSYQIWVSKN